MKLTQEQLAELIAKVFTNLDEKRKACKENGEAVSDGISTEEILAEVTAILEGRGRRDRPAATNDPANPALLPLPTLSPVIRERARVFPLNSSLPSSQLLRVRASRVLLAPARRSPAVPVFRSSPSAKYANLFLSTGSGPDGVKQNSFQTRIASMSAPERRKTAYGMFGRAVKCIHASGGDIERRRLSPPSASSAMRIWRTSSRRCLLLFPLTAATSFEVYANEIIELLYPSTVILQPRRPPSGDGERQSEHPQD